MSRCRAMAVTQAVRFLALRSKAGSRAKLRANDQLRARRPGHRLDVPARENPIYMRLHTYITELALAAEPSRLPGWHVICAGVVDDRTRDG